jgi:hypothetical protein
MSNYNEITQVMLQIAAERDAERKRIKKVILLHSPDKNYPWVCSGCFMRYPCETVRILNEED